MKIYCPIKLTEDQLPKDLKPYYQHMAYICHIIHLNSLFNKYSSRKSDFINIQRESLKEVVGWRVIPKILRNGKNIGFLLKKKIILSDNTYNSPAYAHKNNPAKCYGYKLSKDYKKVHLIEVTDKCLCKSLQKWEDKKYKDFSGVYKFLFDNLNNVQIVVDIRQLGQIIKDEESASYAVSALQNEFYRLKKDEFGRVHTNITNLPSGLRPYIQFKQYPNSHKVIVDISNSQPLLLLLATTPQEQKKRVNQVTQETTSNHYLTTYTPYSAPFLERINYYNLCVKGELYEFLQNRLSFDVSRAEFKKLFFAFLFGNTKERRSNRALKLRKSSAEIEEYERIIEITNVFKKEFRDIYNNLAEFKKKHGYESLAREMQKIESNIMINRVCTRIMNEYPLAPVITIHDAILTIEEHSSSVIKIIKEEWSAYGLSPSIKKEFLDTKFENSPTIKTESSLLKI